MKTATNDTLKFVDESLTGLFGEQLYQAIVQTTELRPKRIARLLGTFRTRAEAEDALRADKRTDR